MQAASPQSEQGRPASPAIPPGTVRAALSLFLSPIFALQMSLS